MATTIKLFRSEYTEREEKRLRRIYGRDLKIDIVEDDEGLQEDTSTQVEDSPTT